PAAGTARQPRRPLRAGDRRADRLPRLDRPHAVEVLMHPAPSIIAFTTLSGLGFGLLAFLGLGAVTPRGWAAFLWFGLGYGLALAGLAASALPLGHPERALKAFSQWRTSWLSREALLASLALLGIAPHAASLVFRGEPVPASGLIGAALALL